MNLLDRNKHIGDPENYHFGGCYTRENPDAAMAEQDLVAALLKHRGAYSRMAEDLGRSRSQIESVVTRNDEYRALRDDLREAVIDEIEASAMQQAINGDSAQQRFFLQTIGKNRGYVTREEKTGKDGAPLADQSRIDASQLPEEVLRQLLEAKAP